MFGPAIAIVSHHRWLLPSLLDDHTVSAMSAGPPEIRACSRRLRRIAGVPDVVALRLEAMTPASRTTRSMIVETWLSRRDVERMLAAFDPPPTTTSNRDPDESD